MSSKAGEISSIIKEQIKQYESKIEMKENGTVITVGDGIATVYGLRSCMANELLRFEDGSFGVAQNLEEETVSVAILSDKDSIQEGSLVYRTGEALSVPVGEGLLGRVVNALGEPIDGKGPVETDGIRPIEAIAAGIIQRQSVSVPLQTGIKAIDSMIPIGRGQRELIIGDRQTRRARTRSVSMSPSARRSRAWCRLRRSLKRPGPCPIRSSYARAPRRARRCSTSPPTPVARWRNTSARRARTC